MRRLIALSVLLVFGSVAYADYEMSDSEKERYLKWGLRQSSGADFALAVAPDGCWGIGVVSVVECVARDPSQCYIQVGIARYKALAQCKKKCKSNACKIMDTNGHSPFIKQRGSSSSSPTVSTPTPAQKPTLTIRSSPTDAKVYIGGAYKGTTELKVKLPLGNYSLRVEKSGYNNFSQQIELKESMVLWPSLSKKEKQKPEPKPQAPKLIGTGTGFLVNKDYVVTAEHVLEDCNVVRVRFGHKEIAAKTVTMDASSDLGLLRLGKSIASAEVSWVVRIGLFKRSANADKYEARLRQHGLDPQRESIMVDGQLATRLFLGPFPSIDKADKEQQSAEIAAHDLALKITEKSATAKLRGGKPIRVGATVATYGYPLFGKLSDSAKITQGHINSLAGIDNDSSRFQYDAPTQFGNSGGPVLDAAGNVVGVVVSGLDDAKTQSINFAVKSNIVENFLSSNNVPYEKADSTEELKLPDIAEKAERFTVLVGCWK